MKDEKKVIAQYEAIRRSGQTNMRMNGMFRNEYHQRQAKAWNVDPYSKITKEILVNRAKRMIGEGKKLGTVFFSCELAIVSKAALKSMMSESN